MRLLLVLPLVAVLSTASRASAGEGVAWSVGVESNGKDPECTVERLTREVNLACDALGGRCAVTNSNPTRQAILRCDNAWTLEAHDAKGALLWSLPIEGDADRMRRAAMWIARAPDTVPPDDTPSNDAIPLITPTPTPAPAPALTPALTPAPSPDAIPSLPASSPSTHASGVLATTRIAFVGPGFGPSLGGRAAAALSLHSPNLALDLALAGARTLSGTMGYAYSSGHAGVGVSWGAPWGTSPLGVSLEGGAALGSVSGPSATTPASQAFVRAYGEAAFTAQWRGSRALRPFATLAVEVESGGTSVAYEGISEASLSWVTASLDVGVAWRSW